jgi:hypothetical protein
LRARQVDPAELSPGQFARLLLNFVERESVRMLIIDSLNGYSKAMQDDKILDLQRWQTEVLKPRPQHAFVLLLGSLLFSQWHHGG